MNMNLFQSLMMGFVSGLAELLPISAEAHRSILRTFFGIGTEDAVFRLLAHMACLTVLFYATREDVLKLRRASALMKVPAKRRRHQPDMPSVYTNRLIRMALIPLIFGKIFTLFCADIADKLYILPVTLLVNAILLLIPSLVRGGNKDSRNMPRLDGFLMGLGAGLSVIPGVSLVGASASIGVARGVDRSFALKFTYILALYGLVIQIGFDSAAIVLGGAAAFSGLGLVIALAGAVAAGIGASLGIRLMRFLAFRAGFSGFAYYSLGAGLLCFILFLTV